jgi:choline dehydrogenase-like flavoprotein
MQTTLARPDFDVVIVGSGIAGALAATRLAAAKMRVLMLEAGGVAPDSLGRYHLLRSYIESPSKATDTPFCGDNLLATQPDPRGPTLGTNYYYYPPGYKGDKFISYYERLVGGSTWHWQGIYVRMLPQDFMMHALYGKGANWPIAYDEIAPWYQDAEREMGVAGEPELRPDARSYRRHAVSYPMPPLVPSFLDRQVAKAVMLAEPLDGIRLHVNTVPHAINSHLYRGRPACEGFTSCVPLCPIKARYEAIVHVEQALASGARLRTQAVVTRLKIDSGTGQVTGVYYKRWQWQAGPDGGKRVPLQEPEQLATCRVAILAANGIENPMILLRSNAANSSGAVGSYLMDHPIKQSYGLATHPLYPFRGPQTTSQIEVFRDGRFRSKFAGFKTSIKNDGWSTNPTGAPRGNIAPPQKGPDGDWHPGTLLDLVQNWGYFGTDLRDKLHDHARRQLTLNSACEQLPIKDNRVMLAPADVTDDMGLQRPQIQYKVDDPDGYVRESFNKIVDVHERVFKAMNITQFKSQRDKPDANLTFGGSGHIMGTTRMGDKSDSVVDKDCRAHDHPNLFILGSSVFPTSSTANPTSTIAALALRAAETIKRQLLRGA